MIVRISARISEPNAIEPNEHVSAQQAHHGLRRQQPRPALARSTTSHGRARRDERDVEQRELHQNSESSAYRLPSAQ